MSHRKLRLAVCGCGAAGKDTACEWFAKHTVLSFTMSTSLWAAQHVFDVWGQEVYPTAEACYADRRNHRERWAEIIWKYNEPDGLTLYRDVLSQTDIACGVRKRSELEACQNAGLVDLAIWIERPGCVESRYSNQITPQDCDLTILNASTLAAFYSKLRTNAKAWGILR